MAKKIGYFVLVVLVIIQFIQPEKNIHPTADTTKNDIAGVLKMQPDVQTILKTSCYDCHSNNTVYPWYSNIQPAAWWLNDHVQEGKKELNFNEFATYAPRRQYKKLEEIIEQVREGEMPLSSYTIIHRNAVLNSNQIDALSAWARNSLQNMEAIYPADSLKGLH